MSRLGLPCAALLVAGLLVPLAPAGAAPVPTCRGEEATIVGTPADDHMTGTPGDDVIVALGGDDVVLGRGGDDLVCGGADQDTLRGGAGDDRLYGQRDRLVSDRGGIYFASDVLDGGPGDDLLDLGDDDRLDGGSGGVLDFRDAPAGLVVDLAAGTATGAGSDALVVVSGAVVIGSRFDDTLLGTEVGDSLYGKGGDDHLDGRGGDDTLHPDANRPHGPAGDDVVAGGPGDDFMNSWDGRDQLFGDDGGDQIWALEDGPAELHGGEGDDRLVVVFPADPGFVVDGGPGDDEGQVESSRRAGAPALPAAVTVTMADGSVVAGGVRWGQLLGVEDVVLAARTAWTYVGTDAPDDLYVVGDSLTATTYGGDDQVVGTYGPDRIHAGDGEDTVFAGGGRDLCWNVEVRHSCQERS